MVDRKVIMHVVAHPRRWLSRALLGGVAALSGVDQMPRVKHLYASLSDAASALL